MTTTAKTDPQPLRWRALAMVGAVCLGVLVNLVLVGLVLLVAGPERPARRPAAEGRGVGPGR